MCSPAEEDACRDDFGDNMEWTCRNCPKTRWEDLDKYTVEMMHARTLRLGGFPFRRGDLTLNEWADQGIIEQCLQIPKF